MTTVSLDQLVKALRENTAIQKALLEEMRQQRSPKKWVGPDEAATILGLNIVKSRKHRLRVSALVRRGLLTKVRDGRPPAYYREEVLQLSEKVAAGKVAI